MILDVMNKKFKTKKDLKKSQIVTAEDVESIFVDEESLVDELVDYVDLCYLDEVLDIIQRYTDEKIKQVLENYKKTK